MNSFKLLQVLTLSLALFLPSAAYTEELDGERYEQGNSVFDRDLASSMFDSNFAGTAQSTKKPPKKLKIEEMRKEYQKNLEKAREKKHHEDYNESETSVFDSF